MTAMKTPACIKSTVTFIDGSTYHNEFPPWASPVGKLNKEEKKVPTGQKPNAYYESLKLIFFVLTLLGILPVFRIKVGSHKIQAFLGGSICLTVYVLFAYFTYLMTRDILDLIFHDDDFSSIIVQVTVMMLLSQHVFYLVLTWPESIAVNKYLVQWRDFQEQYEQLTKCKLNLSCKRKVAVYCLMSAAMAAVYAYFCAVVDEKIVTSTTSSLVLMYHFFIQLCFYHLWFANSWAITETAQQYNDHLARECTSDVSAERLEDYRLVWMRLTELVRAGSSMLSYTMAFMVTTPFAYEVIAAYNLTMYVIRSIQMGDPGNSQEAIITGISFLLHGTLLYMFCDSGHCMTTECEKVQDVLLTHKPRSPLGIAKVNIELRLFLRCLRSVPPLATLSGYVTINRKVFLHLTGVLVTYLIILVQFNIGSLQKGGGNKTTTSKPI